MPLTLNQLSAIRRSLGRYSEDVTGSVLDDVTNGIKRAVESLIQPVVDSRGVLTGLNPATARSAIADLLEANSVKGLMDSSRIDFALTVARDVAQGAGNFAKEALDPAVVDEFPAWELVRVYDRDVPRGFRKVKGTLVPVPGDDWESRWAAAGGELSDGRMIALKSDSVWQNLGDGVGGYTDTLGNPFPPFAFNSGFDVNNISRAECVDLGLIKEGEPVRPAAFDLSTLFSPISQAA